MKFKNIFKKAEPTKRELLANLITQAARKMNPTLQDYVLTPELIDVMTDDQVEKTLIDLTALVEKHDEFIKKYKGPYDAAVSAIKHPGNN
jgi:hypothetical protein